MMMMITANSHARQKQGNLERKENRNFDIRRHSYRSFPVRDVGCEGQEKRWTELWDCPPQEGQKALEDNSLSSRQECWELQKDEWSWKGKSCRGEGCLPLLLLFAENNFEGYGLGHCFIMKEIVVGFITNCGHRISFETYGLT